MLLAELSALWVILENARPQRMKGYGRELAPQDKAEWETLVQNLMHEIDLIRSAALRRSRHPRGGPDCSVGQEPLSDTEEGQGLP
jgi:hypothetical protein